MKHGGNLYDFLDKYGFNDGHDLYPEEENEVRILCEKIVEQSGIIGCKWKPYVIETCGHSPCYIRFKNIETGYDHCFFDMDIKEKDEIEAILRPIRDKLFNEPSIKDLKQDTPSKPPE
jgi:hypothetical protein